MVPVLVGGSALYIRAIVDDFEFPGTDPALRAALEAELADDRSGGAARAGWPRLDPASAAQILPGNGRRVVRALEVIELTGQPFTAAASAAAATCCREWSRSAWTSTARGWTQRIAERVDAMWAAGLVDEVAAAGRHTGCGTGSRPRGPSATGRCWPSWTARLTEDEARTRTVTATRRFARRQDSWFRKDPRIAWLPFDRPDLVDAGWSRSRRGRAARVPD